MMTWSEVGEASRQQRVPGVRSLVRRNSVLLKGSVVTNFLYQVRGGMPYFLNLEEANAMPKIASRIKYVRERGYTLQFVGVESEILFSNLQFIDSELPKIIAYLVEYKYAGDAGPNIAVLLKQLIFRNPLDFDMSQGHPFYEYKIRRFLVAAVLGMLESEFWLGDMDARVGNIAVETGDGLIFFNPYNFSEFETYLVKNTRLEQASTTRYRFGDLYRLREDVYIKLNLQVRFV